MSPKKISFVPRRIAPKKKAKEETKTKDQKKNGRKKPSKQAELIREMRLEEEEKEAKRLAEEEDIRQEAARKAREKGCKNCFALYFDGEHKKNNPKGLYDDCCNLGKINTTAMHIDKSKVFPAELKDLFLQQDPAFIQNIRRLNGDFAFGSMYASTYQFDKASKFNCYRIHGQVYRSINIAANPNDNSQAKGGQIFFFDIKEAVEQRKSRIKCSDELLKKLHRCIADNNPYAAGFISMKEEIMRQKDNADINDEPEPDVKLLFGINPGTDDRTHNLQTVNEVAAIFVPTAEGDIPQAKIVVHERGKQYQDLNHLDGETEPLLYPLLKPYGEQGWECTWQKENIKRHKTLIGVSKQLKKMSLNDYYKFWLAYRNHNEAGFFNPLHLAGRLFQQWMVDQFCRLETDRLIWYRLHQEECKRANYQSLKNWLETHKTKVNAKEIGRMTILPSTFIGGPRYEMESYYDEMAICAEIGKPDLFITYTCDGKDPDIINAINSSSKGDSENHPTLVCRVFKLKLKKLMDDIVKDQIFGKVRAWVYKIEFQKRGLPHAHILITLDGRDKWQIADIDRCGIWARIPQREEVYELFAEKKKLILENIFKNVQDNNEKRRMTKDQYLESREMYLYPNNLGVEYDKIRAKNESGHYNINFDTYFEEIQEEFYQVLRGLVKKNMCHGMCTIKKTGPHPCRVHHPCASCKDRPKKDRIKNCIDCSKNPTYCKHQFPFHERDNTTFNEDGDVLYMRPLLRESEEITNLLNDIKSDLPKKVEIAKMKEKVDKDAKCFYFGSKYEFQNDNRWIVQYNPWLLMRYRSHINVQFVKTWKSVKYLYKYIHKGFDKANIQFTDDEKLVYDEINQYLEMRYIGPTEAAWRFLNFDMNEKSHHVERLTVHLKDEQEVEFDVNDDGKKIEEKADKAKTKLMAFFEICSIWKKDIQQYNVIKSDLLCQQVHLEKQISGELKSNKSRKDLKKELTKVKDKFKCLILINCHENWRENIKDLLETEKEENANAKPEEMSEQDKEKVAQDKEKEEGVGVEAHDTDKNEIEDKIDAGGMLFKDMPKKFTWNTKARMWTVRKSHFNCIGRIHPVSPRECERYHLRILLHHVRSPINFDVLKDDCETFQAACLKAGLIQDDQEEYNAMKEARHSKMPNMIRDLFVIILLYSNPAKPRELWEEFKDSMIEDLEKMEKYAKYDKDTLYKIALHMMYKKIRENGKDPLKDFPSLPQFAEQDLEDIENEYTADKHRRVAEEMRKKMNKEQLEIFNKISHIITTDDQDANRCHFVYGPGGCGKSFVYIALYHFAMGNNKKVVNTAFSGIAATILPEGITNHKMLKLPLDIDENSKSLLQNHMPEAEVLRNAFKIVWDEAPMSPRYVLEICDTKLKEIMDSNKDFGGKVMLLGGDFRQVVPVKKYAIRPEVVGLCIKSSRLWEKFEVHHLVQNMRADPAAQQFAADILAIGNGETNDKNGRVKIPDQCIVKESLAKVVFENAIAEGNTTGNWDTFSKRAILCPYNYDVAENNQQVLNMLDGKEQIMYSIDKQETEDGPPVPEELLKHFNVANFPNSRLKLKRNAIIMTLRNLLLENRLCNGTRLRIIEILNHLLKCEVIFDDAAGEKRKDIFIPRITLVDDKNFGVKLHRKQFPVKLASAMSINKSQGQTLDFAGIDLRRDVFSHGQLYVGVSRVRSWDCLKLRVPEDNEDGKVLNIVWKEIL